MQLNKITVKDYLTEEEIQELLKRSDWKAAVQFLHTWVWIDFAFGIAGISLY